jgi:broad specificity phosphatase PhoE
MGQIFLVRHGQASFGEAEYDRLSALGTTQAKLLGDWWAACGQGFGRVVIGTMKRHRQTAEACLAALPDTLRPKAEWRADAGFDEYDHDEMLVRSRPEFADPSAAKAALEASGNPRKFFAQTFATAFARWQSGEFDAEYRESWPAFRARCAAALERAGAGDDAPTLVFTSGGPIAAITQSLLGVPDEKVAGLNWSLANSAVTKVFHKPGRVTLGYLNSIAHLERTGRAEQITYR